MEEQLRTLLLNTTAITTLVGQRIAWGEHPQGTPLPAIVLTVISDIDGYHMNGANNMFRGRVQADVYAMTYGAAKGIVRAIVKTLNFYRGGQFLIITHAGSYDNREGGTNEAERPYRITADFTTAWKGN